MTEAHKPSRSPVQPADGPHRWASQPPAVQPPLLMTLMRRYVSGFVNSQDFSVCRELMSEDYVLHAGDTVHRGRDSAYIPAVARQFRQFPTLGFSIHDLVSDGEYAALLFSEHGVSLRWDGRRASWTGVSIYRRSGDRLVECWVEQDYYARHVQLAAAEPAPLEPVALDPWFSAVQAPDTDRERAVRDWLDSGEWWAMGDWNPGPLQRDNPELAIESTRPLAVMATATRAAFNAEVQCRYLGGIPGLDPAPRQVVTAYAAGLADIAEGAVSGVRGVISRAGLQRALVQKA